MKSTFLLGGNDSSVHLLDKFVNFGVGGPADAAPHGGFFFLMKLCVSVWAFTWKGEVLYSCAFLGMAVLGDISRWLARLG